MRKRDTAAEDAGFGPGQAPTGGRITPTDVQQKEFRVARFGGGYRMREVDEFLDQVTDALSALLAENEQLRAGRPAAPSSAARPIADDAERSAVDRFLQREKGFLQDLGGLVQGHAEELKEMVRAARRHAAAAAPAPDAAAAPAIEEAGERPAPPPADEAVVVADAAEPEHPDAPPDARPAEASEGSPDEEDATVAADDEAPIRLEEPEPARSRRSEDDPDGSLRELFWGEE
jgi:DivIVA domain-containing protein